MGDGWGIKSVSCDLHSAIRDAAIRKGGQVVASGFPVAWNIEPDMESEPDSQGMVVKSVSCRPAIFKTLSNIL